MKRDTSTMDALRCAGFLCTGKKISGAKKNTSGAAMNSAQITSAKVVNSARMRVQTVPDGFACLQFIPGRGINYI